MDKASIVNAIISHVESAKTKDYSLWTIGITQNPIDRREDHGNPAYWQSWEAVSLDDAQEIESHFINEKGMVGGTGGDLHLLLTTYVYIF